ncbi:uncharacterized protein LOC135945712 [Cloeon dipterum]|uniref:uncharacterized protein LOC135945712 n=1 Tax=Cloeon dipterum TaxID=197152 RepID=UPI00322037CF
MAEAAASTSSTAAPSKESAETAPVPESKRLMLFQSCLDSLNKKLSDEYKECLKQLYGPAFESHPQYVDKIHDAFMKSFNTDVSRRMQRFLEEHNIAQKLKELEDISENQCEGVDKAWRPTGLSAVQQQVAVDIDVKMNMMDKLQKDLDKEEAELQELMAKATKYREQSEPVRLGLEEAEKKKKELEASVLKTMEMLRRD